MSIENIVNSKKREMKELRREIESLGLHKRHSDLGGVYKTALHNAREYVKVPFRKEKDLEDHCWNVQHAIQSLDQYRRSTYLQQMDQIEKFNAYRQVLDAQKQALKTVQDAYNSSMYDANEQRLHSFEDCLRKERTKQLKNQLKRQEDKMKQTNQSFLLAAKDCSKDCRERTAYEKMIRILNQEYAFCSTELQRKREIAAQPKQSWYERTMNWIMPKRQERIQNRMFTQTDKLRHELGWDLVYA